ncbi:MAG: hypothetical protein JSU87_13460 [Gemmatimonadota bacterium]|nr:MAG: hypothetical protein JSU87_13460 [Gemmatimonadota bacterium]
MHSFPEYRVIALACLLLVAGCDDFDRDEAALQIRERFCEGWPYGCTDSTRVVIEDVDETRNGRQVVFRVVDRRDETARLSAAYFELEGDDWSFFLFENPFNDAFKAEAGRYAEDSRRYSDALMELKSKQRWFVTIYGRYAQVLQELDSVSYKSSDIPLEMTVIGDGWGGRISGRYAECEIEIPSQQLPTCRGVLARNAGTADGPLSEAFGAER